MVYDLLNNVSDTHSDVILDVLPLGLLHFTPSQVYLVGKHGSPIQFFFTPYSILIAMMASTSMQKYGHDYVWEVGLITYTRITKQLHKQERKRGTINSN